MRNEKSKPCLPPPTATKVDAYLRRVYYDILDENSTTESRQIKQINCDCCGMSEECTHGFISGVRKIFCGKWVCGICSEAVKEIVKRQPNMTMEEALESHISVCMNFSNTTRLNPKLSFASAMRDIARRYSLRRRTMDSVPESSKMSRTLSFSQWLETSQ
ncbi:DUF1677 family protein (DUF1677) [Rhynchospora pubera]|uniref:DUF1677 family protein (DUF1677) n=1 Tax=Rhynchospora pubera TaxID=906938 RepID=A0AAV8DG99_9POAL|nr:DUF1677 family protein (DUF1677) [Rhynchospora pubera]